jgi:hypothetical protein
MENNLEQLFLPEPGLWQKLRKHFIVIGIALILALVGAVLIYYKNKPSQTVEPAQTNAPIIITPMIITSDAFQNNGVIPAKYTCDGLNINPPLRFSDIPSHAKSLVLIVDDPDAISGDWSHWILWNILPTTESIHENSVPPTAIQGATDFGANKYGGPCPPTGSHHYKFKLYALDAMLNLPKDTTKSRLLNAIQGHIITDAILTGVYNR